MIRYYLPHLHPPPLFKLENNFNLCCKKRNTDLTHAHHLMKIMCLFIQEWALGGFIMKWLHLQHSQSQNTMLISTTMTQNYQECLPSRQSAHHKNSRPNSASYFRKASSILQSNTVWYRQDLSSRYSYLFCISATTQEGTNLCVQIASFTIQITANCYIFHIFFQQ